MWKGILEDFFDDFLRFIHPDADEIFDFKRGITFLNKELEQLFPPEKDELSVKIVDKLAKLYTRKEKKEWVLIHCEVQGEYKSGFPHHMYTYFYRIFDKYGKRISTYAILTEETPKVRINKYTAKFLGTKLEYHMSLSKEKIRLIISFLKNYIRFENSENNINFEKQYEQIECLFEIY